MGLKGKFVRREGTGVIFGSQKRPEWKPIDLSGQIDPNGLIPGEYYELELSDNRLVGYTKLASRAPDSGGGGGGRSYGGGGNGGEVNASSLMASATGFAKSAMESGICKTPAEAAQAGIRWAKMWGEVPNKEKEEPKPEPTHTPYDDDRPF